VLQIRSSVADVAGMAKLVLSLFRRSPRRRIVILHGPRHA
jgi:hypothetical protein